MIRTMQHFVYHSSKKDGFTYMEALAALSVAALIMSAMPPVISYFGTLDEHTHDFEPDFFVLDISEVYKESNEIEVSAYASSISFANDNRSISYHKSGNRIIRSVDSKGFVTVMFGVKNFEIKEGSRQISMVVETENGEFNETFTFKK